jgi:hypothetical protein
MKLKVLAVSMLAVLSLLTVAGSASAFVYHMRYGQAKHASLGWVSELCESSNECTGYGTGQCFRQSESSFACTVGLFSPGAFQGEEIECDTVLRWGVATGGTIVLKYRGPFNCH